MSLPLTSDPSSSKMRILVVEDDPNLRRVLSILFETQGWSVAAVETAEEALHRLAEVQPHFVLTDLRLPGMDGIALLGRLLARQPSLPVAVASAHGDVPLALTAVRNGAVDFLVKPIDRDRLLRCVQIHVPGAAGGSTTGFDTRNPRMQQVLDVARTLAQSELSVLIRGPSGSGKEVLARAIHHGGPRAKAPFIAVNCAAMPPALLESELFGHARGAFTGAVSDHPGLFRAAHGGTLMLDEIGDMPLPLQAKLLRVLQDRVVRPVGASASIAVDVRVLSATHRDLAERMAQGSFREDLYYRLTGVTLALPSLAERREDIPLLIQHQLDTLVAAGSPRRTFSPRAMELLLGANWPGNIRQLFNFVEQAVALSPSRLMDEALVRRCLGESGATAPSLDTARDAHMAEYLERLLQRTDGNMAAAARLAGRNRTDFYKLLARHRPDLAVALP